MFGIKVGSDQSELMMAKKFIMSTSTRSAKLFDLTPMIKQKAAIVTKLYSLDHTSLKYHLDKTDCFQMNF